MADLPLLIFPKAKPLSLPPEKGRPFSGLHFPSLQRQIERMQPQFDTIQQEFEAEIKQFRKAKISLSDLGLEPEIVLVIEIVGTIDDFKKAIEKTEGLEWLAVQLDLSGSSEKNVSGEPVAALLDGAPFEQHSLLKDRVKIDDPDDFLSEYQPGEKKHGTAMASLLIYGELDAKESPLESQIYCRPILQPDPATQNGQESYPESLLIEYLIHRSVKPDILMPGGRQLYTRPIA